MATQPSATTMAKDQHDQHHHRSATTSGTTSSSSSGTSNEEWIHDWDYKRILPENLPSDDKKVSRTAAAGTTPADDNDNANAKHDQDDDDDVMMDVDEDLDADPLSLSQHKEANIFWSRVPFSELEDCFMNGAEDDDDDLMVDEDDLDMPVGSFHKVPFQEISHRDFMGHVQRQNRHQQQRPPPPPPPPPPSHSELAKFAEAPPLSWEAHQEETETEDTDSISMSDDDIRFMTGEKTTTTTNKKRRSTGGNGSKPSPRGSSSSRGPSPSRAVTMTTHAPPSPTHSSNPVSKPSPYSSPTSDGQEKKNNDDDIFVRQQKLLQEVLQRPLNHQSNPVYHPLPQPSVHQEKLLSEISHYPSTHQHPTNSSMYANYRPGGPGRNLPQPTGTQEKLLHEMRSLMHQREVDDKMFYQRQQELLEELRRQQKRDAEENIVAAAKEHIVAAAEDAAAAAANMKKWNESSSTLPTAAMTMTMDGSSMHNASTHSTGNTTIATTEGMKEDMATMADSTHSSSTSVVVPPPPPPPIAVTDDVSMNVVSPAGGGKSPESPTCVSERLTRAGMDTKDYQQFVTKLTHENLFRRQQALLSMSMQKTQDSRKALYDKKALERLLQGKSAQQKLSKVLQDIETSTMKVQDLTTTTTTSGGNRRTSSSTSASSSTKRRRDNDVDDADTVTTPSITNRKMSVDVPGPGDKSLVEMKPDISTSSSMAAGPAAAVVVTPTASTEGEKMSTPTDDAVMETDSNRVVPDEVPTTVDVMNPAAAVTI